MTDNKNQDMPMNTDGKTCNCPHHKALPWLVILFGVLFLLGDLGIGVSLMMVGWIWPILVILAGVVMLKKRDCKCCSK